LLRTEGLLFAPILLPSCTRGADADGCPRIFRSTSIEAYAPLRKVRVTRSYYPSRSAPPPNARARYPSSPTTLAGHAVPCEGATSPSARGGMAGDRLRARNRAEARSMHPKALVMTAAAASLVLAGCVSTPPEAGGPGVKPVFTYAVTSND